MGFGGKNCCSFAPSTAYQADLRKAIKSSKIQRLFLIGLIGNLVLFSLIVLVIWLVFRKKRQ